MIGDKIENGLKRGFVIPHGLNICEAMYYFFSFYCFLFFVIFISFASYFILSINLERSSAIAQRFVSYISVCPNVNFHGT